MIDLLDGMPPGVLGVEAHGKIAPADFTDVLAPAIAEATKDGQKLRVMLVFTGKFEGIEPSAVWEDLKMGVRSWSHWERLALVTDHDWVKNAVRLFGWAIPGEVRVFDVTERDDAVAWAAAT